MVNPRSVRSLHAPDVAFLKDGVAAEADPNCETVVISELDLGSLEEQRELGSVRPLYDRRSDLYDYVKGPD
ncbi:MAG: hypothetical protein R3B91_13970 [Planctomycetaceae bacterium]